MAHALMPRYARAQTVPSTDARIKASFVTYTSPGWQAWTRKSCAPTAGVPFYGPAAEPASVLKIKAPLLVQLAENDARINDFYNNSTPRYNEAAAKPAWERTIAFFKKSLA